MTRTITIPAKRPASRICKVLVPGVIVLLVTIFGWYIGALPYRTQLSIDRTLHSLVGPNYFLLTRIRSNWPYELAKAEAAAADLSPFTTDIDKQSAQGKDISLVWIEPPGGTWTDEKMGKVYWDTYADTIADRLGYGFSGSAWKPYNKEAHASVFLEW
ncbi:MAG: hypothetical protein EON60_12315 [Alphaproteobacteria bacterium]|nr:MAG: hypothetical protein EON60_12315 [Alphaproteobacteria bacterium]